MKYGRRTASSSSVNCSTGYTLTASASVATDRRWYRWATALGGPAATPFRGNAAGGFPRRWCRREGHTNRRKGRRHHGHRDLRGPARATTPSTSSGRGEPMAWASIRRPLAVRIRGWGTCAPSGRRSRIARAFTTRQRVHLHFRAPVAGVTARDDVVAAQELTARDDDRERGAVVHHARVDDDARAGRTARPPLLVGRHAEDHHVHREQLTTVELDAQRVARQLRGTGPRSRTSPGSEQADGAREVGAVCDGTNANARPGMPRDGLRRARRRHPRR